MHAATDRGGEQTGPCRGPGGCRPGSSTRTHGGAYKTPRRRTSLGYGGLVARTLAQQLHEELQRACAPFQYALSTKAGAEALVRAIRAPTESDPRTTVLSVDGVGAYDHISRALADRPALAGLLPYAALFYGSPSTYVFYDAEGRAHDVRQGEGGEQGDPLMPSLFALSQHQALLETRARLHPSNTLYAFLDDIYVTGPPGHTVGQFAIVTCQHPGAPRQDTRGRKPRDSSRCSPRRTTRTRAGRGTGPSWAAQLAAATSSPRSSLNDCRSRTACCHASLGCLSCNPRGSSCSTAQHPAARTYYEPCRRQTPQSSLPSTMLPSGAAWQHCWRAGMATCRCQTSATVAPTPIESGRPGAGICGATSACRLYWSSWADTVDPRTAQKHQPGVLAALLRPLLDASATGTPPNTRAAEQAAASCAQKASQHQPGRDCWRKMQRHPCYAQHDPLQVEDRAGNTRHRKPSTSARSRCSSTTSTLERCCCHRLAMQRAAPSRPSQRAPTHGCRTRSTESCSSQTPPASPARPQALSLLDAWMSTATIARLACK